MSDFTELTEKLNIEFKNKNLSIAIPNLRDIPSYHIPIQTLCDIPVSCSVNFGKTIKMRKREEEGEEYPYWMSLRIQTSILVATDDPCEDFDTVVLYWKHIDIKSTITESNVEELFKELPDLVFDKYTGKFVLNKSSNTIFAFLKKNKNVKTSFQECCVCMEDTTTTTCCNHYCCYECMSKIKPTLDEDDECSNILCPICRTIIAN